MAYAGLRRREVFHRPYDRHHFALEVTHPRRGVQQRDVSHDDRRRQPPMHFPERRIRANGVDVLG